MKADIAAIENPISPNYFKLSEVASKGFWSYWFSCSENTIMPKYTAEKIAERMNAWKPSLLAVREAAF